MSYDQWKLATPPYYDTTDEEEHERAHEDEQFMAWAESIGSDA